MPESVALLVIHGIGQQAPYEILDQFARKLINCCQASNVKWTLQPLLKAAMPSSISRRQTYSKHSSTPASLFDPQKGYIDFWLHFISLEKTPGIVIQNTWSDREAESLAKGTIFSATQLRTSLSALINLDSYAFENVADYYFGDDENNQQCAQEVLISAIASLPTTS
jgi:hypothetical protein